VDRLWLDLRPVGVTRLQRQFPAILERCRSLGLEPLEQPLPISPAAHYWMGGVRTDLQALTDLPGLYAIGEVASSGVHGANRLASNSLMECLVMARQLQGLVPGSHHDGTPAESAAPLDLAMAPTALDHLERDGERLRQLCWRVAGVARDGGPLRRALAHENRRRQELGLEGQLAPVLNSAPDSVRPVDATQQRWLEAAWSRRSLGRVALLLLEAAAFRQESRGGHHRVDAPASQPFWERHTLQQRGRAIRSAPVV
jgi:L-aspartate oxidase